MMKKEKYTKPVAIDLAGFSAHGQTTPQVSCSAGESANQTEGLCLIGPAPSSGTCTFGLAPSSGACNVGSAPSTYCVTGGAD